ncbi:ABC transporter ATP-binding protein [Erysipelothrix urinaevulpis]|uniref:ABC transporter ATP-binding protein n=1 Tax=Erysipelothrix urinaevulpis TaxID=2683717 RepID=UPI00135A42D3|nr:ABC transporter ATP-binding protein [Erysipelothrix urinaevulpis]
MSKDKNYNEDSTSNSLDVGLWKKMIGLMANQKKQIILALGFVFAEAMIAIALPVLNRHAIDVYFSGGGTTREIILFALAYFFLISLQAYLIYEFIYRSGKIEMAVSYETRKKAMEKLQELPFSYYDVTDSGWIMARVTSDIARLSSILSWSLIDLVWGGFIMVLLIGVMLLVNVKLAMIIIVVLPIVFIVSSWFQKKMLTNYRDLRAINSQVTSAFSEGISGAKTTKTLALEEQQFKDFDTLTSSMKKKAMQAIVLSSLYIPSVILLSTLSEAGILWIGTEMVIQDVIAIGTLIMFSQYATQFFQPLRNIAAILAQLQMAQASAERVIGLLETKVELADHQHVQEKYGTILNPKPNSYEKIKGKIEFENVEFYYNEKEPILNNFNLKIEPKQSIALVGETGSGKSTIVNLICRFYEPISGKILVDDHDYKERSIGSLRSQLGYVLQSPHLFSGSVKDNLKFGKLDANDDEIIEVCKLVGAHEFIMNLDGDYDFDVGEGGDRLSSGQKQLISFARALLPDPSIIVLDEATSSIDTETEAVIQYAIDSLFKEKTSVIIAHRLSTIVNVDRILLIDKGEIKEDGSHDELMKKQGMYYQLYQSQLKDDELNEVL